MNNIYNQLPQPCLIVEDFNAHNELWESMDTDGRGRTIEAFTVDHSLNIMNNGAPTRILYDTESAIDLSICSPQLEVELQCSVLTSPGDNDHCLIIIAYDEREDDRDSGYWEIKRAR